MREVALEAGLSQPFLSQIERGQAQPSMRSLDRIAHALGASAVSLLSHRRSGGQADIVRVADRVGLLQDELDPGSRRSPRRTASCGSSSSPVGGASSKPTPPPSAPPSWTGPRTCSRHAPPRSPS